MTPPGPRAIARTCNSATPWNFPRDGRALGDASPELSPEISPELGPNSSALPTDPITDLPLEDPAPADPGPPPGEPERRHQQRKSAAELVVAALNDPLTIPMGGLIQQLARSHSAQGATYVPWEILQALRQIQRTPETQLQFAARLIELGDFYRNHNHQGQRQVRCLVIAIAAYEQALVSLRGYPQRWPSICYDLGQIYLSLSRQHPSYRLDGLRRAIATYQRGLEPMVVDAPDPSLYLELQNQLGEAYSSLAKSQEPLVNWKGAIAAYQAALVVCPGEKPDPVSDLPIQRNERHGAIQNNLGTALWNLAQQILLGQQAETPKIAS
ncbi:MAG: hypothetical protein HC824_11910 [Synechococcales cyanobacterium RM1_1_8]|nr:hypothetical protein [Synechococcales cyanobacterium RM1_1_8]